MSEYALPVLVVEDDPCLREAIGDTLELAGRAYVAVDGGEAALRVMAAEPFDAVLMDLRMPGLDGVETLERLRAAEGPNRAVPVLAFTADPEAEA